MTIGDILGLILSYVYAFSLLIIVEAIGKKASLPQIYTRKIIHVGAGLWVWPMVWLFDHWYFGIIPFATFIILNYIFYKKHSFSQMDKDNNTLGTVYFAISITALLFMFWRTGNRVDYLPVAMAGIMCMTLGDGFAAIIGQRFGKIKYATIGTPKTIEGSLTMLLMSFLSVFVSFYFLPGSVFSPSGAEYGLIISIYISFFASIVATMLEALSPSGLDNISVPIFTSLFIYGILLILIQ